jgi:hypothetical protein
MNKINLFSNPFNIFLMFIIISLINILMPVHFISILLAGFVFMAFIYCVKYKYYYSLFFVFMTFIFIEISSGLNIGTLSLLSYFIYLFLVPNIKYFLSSKTFYLIILIMFFYLGVFLLFAINTEVNQVLVSKIVINYIIDIFLISFI